MSTWQSLNRRIMACQRCPRLRAYCQQIATEKRHAFQDWEYWGKPVANFGDARAKLLIVGLAPAAHGANRTGRMFTGDRSGDWLYRALHRAGFASQPNATNRRDGLKLLGCAITAAAHCAPPGNRPTRQELLECQEWLDATIDLLPVRTFLALGQIAWQAIVDACRRREWLTGRRPKFTHSAQVSLTDGRWLIGSYHPSQQNTFTGRLTEAMLDDVFAQARRLVQA